LTPGHHFRRYEEIGTNHPENQCFIQLNKGLNRLFGVKLDRLIIVKIFFSDRASKFTPRHFAGPP
jgi:hypothetical protein